MLYPSWAFMFAAVVFLAVIVILALRPASSRKVVSVVVICSALLGLGFYGFGYGMQAQAEQRKDDDAWELLGQLKSSHN